MGNIKQGGRYFWTIALPVPVLSESACRNRKVMQDASRSKNQNRHVMHLAGRPLHHDDGLHAKA